MKKRNAEGKKEEGKMKRLSLAALIVIVLSTGAFAQYEIGSLGIYTDQSATDCDFTFTAFVPTNLVIMYYRSTSGPDGITAAEFRLDAPAATFTVTDFVESPEVSLTFGTISNGIACSFSGCTGTGDDYVVIGTVSILALNTNPATMKIEASNDITLPPFSPRVAICGLERPVVAVLGGWFSAPDGTCNVGTEEKSWGAIKEMYNE
jgi:hypothetical protein